MSGIRTARQPAVAPDMQHIELSLHIPGNNTHTNAASKLSITWVLRVSSKT